MTGADVAGSVRPRLARRCGRGLGLALTLGIAIACSGTATPRQPSAAGTATVTGRALAHPLSLHQLRSFDMQAREAGIIVNAVAVDRTGKVYVGETDPNLQRPPRVDVFDSGGSVITSFGAGGAASSVTALTVDEQGSIYVADFEKTQIVKFSPDGKPVGHWATEPPVGPTGLAASAGHIYVLNHRQHEHHVQVFDTDGRLLQAWGSDGNAPDEFVAGGAGGPDQIAIDGAGNLFATDPGNSRVAVFDSSGKFERQIGVKGNHDGQFLDGPYGVAVDGSGHVYALEGNGTIQEFDAEGKFISRWDSTGGQRQLAVDGQGRLYVAGLRSVGEYEVVG